MKSNKEILIEAIRDYVSKERAEGVLIEDILDDLEDIVGDEMEKIYDENPV